MTLRIEGDRVATNIYKTLDLQERTLHNLSTMLRDMKSGIRRKANQRFEEKDGRHSTLYSLVEITPYHHLTLHLDHQPTIQSFSCYHTRSSRFNIVEHGLEQMVRFSRLWHLHNPQQSIPLRPGPRVERRSSIITVISPLNKTVFFL